MRQLFHSSHRHKRSFCEWVGREGGRKITGQCTKDVISYIIGSYFSFAEAKNKPNKSSPPCISPQHPDPYRFLSGKHRKECTKKSSIVILHYKHHPRSAYEQEGRPLLDSLSPSAAVLQQSPKACTVPGNAVGQAPCLYRLPEGNSLRQSAQSRGRENLFVWRKNKTR